MSYTGATFSKEAQHRLLGTFNRYDIIFYLEIALEDLKKQNSQLKKEITSSDLEYEKRFTLNHHIKRIHEFLRWEKVQEDQYKVKAYEDDDYNNPPW